MKRSLRSLSAFLLFMAGYGAASQTPEVIGLGTRKELFVDSYLLDSLKGVTLRLHEPRDEGVAFAFDKPWEGPFCAYVTILRTDSLYRAYYRGMSVAGPDDGPGQVTCVAESKDGIAWYKPERKAGEGGNVVLSDHPSVSHNFSPFRDKNPKARKIEQFKAVGGSVRTGLFAYASPDGIQWRRMQAQPVFSKGMFDSQNVAFWSESEQRYVLYFRTWSEGGFKGKRTVSRTTSTDFIHWEEPVAMTFGDTPQEDLYTHQTSPYFGAPHLYIAIGARFMPGRKVVTDGEARALRVNPAYYNDCSDAVLMTSRGGNRYDRTFMESFLRPGIGLKNWVSRSNYPALNVVQTGPDEMSLYVGQDYAQPTAHLHRYSLRLDGFASLSAPYRGGTATTRFFTFAGRELELNYATSAAGEIAIQLEDGQGRPVSGYTFADFRTLVGNETARVVEWAGKKELGALAGKVIRLRIRMKDADLFALRFR